MLVKKDNLGVPTYPWEGEIRTFLEVPFIMDFTGFRGLKGDQNPLPFQFFMKVPEVSSRLPVSEHRSRPDPPPRTPGISQRYPAQRNT